MARVIWTEPALQDLDAIAEYIALDDVSAAQRLVKEVFERVDLLASSPESGRQPPELQHMSYREIIIGPCRIFYRIEKERVSILYVMRGEQQLNKYLLEARKQK